MSRSKYLDVKSTVDYDSGIGNLVSQPIGSVQWGVGYAVFEVFLHLKPPFLFVFVEVKYNLYKPSKRPVKVRKKCQTEQNERNDQAPNGSNSSRKGLGGNILKYFTIGCLVLRGTLRITNMSIMI